MAKSKKSAGRQAASRARQGSQAKKKLLQKFSGKATAVPERGVLQKYPLTSLGALVTQAEAVWVPGVSDQACSEPGGLHGHLSNTLSNDLPSPLTCPLVVFFAFTDGQDRAEVVHFAEQDLGALRKAVASWAASVAARKVRWLRVDWVTDYVPLRWAELAERLKGVKRNYFRYGLVLDAAFEQAFLEQELNANAMLYPQGEDTQAGLNPERFAQYARKRFGARAVTHPEQAAQLGLFSTEGALLTAKAAPVALAGYCGGVEGRDTGRRILNPLATADVEGLIAEASAFLADQVDGTGRFVYGLHPCFDREIKTYNTLRHASTTYSMLEAWEVTGDKRLLAAIERSLGLLTQTFIQRYPQANGQTLAFLTDLGQEIKLGGNAVAILALVKYSELTGSKQYWPLLEQLAMGIQSMQNPQTGEFVHVLNSADLSVKEAFRIIYYDGEAAFGLMRLYGLTRDDRWLQVVENAFEFFIAKQHWRAHDHWLSYCVNELTLYRPDPKYFEFGIQNVLGFLDFVMERITTFPTLLELMMAAHKMIVRMQASPALSELLRPLDLDQFYRALNVRAHYLLNGFFWPEFAMFFKHPNRILGSFFIRHHSFRVRIDDVEHYLSGFIAYLRYFLQSSPTEPSAPARMEPNPTELRQSDANQSDAKQAKRPAPSVTEDVFTFDFSEAAESAPVDNSVDSSVDNSVCDSVNERLGQLTRQADEALVAWGGDVNLGRRQHFRSQQIGFEKTLDIPELSEADASIVNLECVVSTLGEQGVIKGEGGPYYYRARPEMLKVLTAAQIDAVTTANNHSGDYGPAALLQQKQILDRLGMVSCGSGRNSDEAFAPCLVEANGFRIALFSIDSTQPRFQAGADSAGAAFLPPNQPRVWLDTLKPLFAQARQKADFVWVAIHWGPNLAEAPDAAEIAVGHAVVDAGADVILGASAHKIQGVEIYRGKPIIHDAGDLLFDSIRSDLASSGVFLLRLNAGGVRQVTFVPVGVGFGYSKTLTGAAARQACEDLAAKSRALGAVFEVNDDGQAVLLLDQASAPFSASAAETRAAIPQPNHVGYDGGYDGGYDLRALMAFQPDAQVGVCSQVPEAARIAPVRFGSMQLIGLRVHPKRIEQRKMLWVETFWMTTQPMDESVRLDIKAVPIAKTTMPVWGKGMEHEPCDWLRPTTTWAPKVVYRDFYGLRPPVASRLENVPLKLHVNVVSGSGVYQDYVHPEVIEIEIAGLLSAKQALDYRTEFPPCLFETPDNQTWTAQQLAEITGGKWLNAPPVDWFVRSVVNGQKHLDMRELPCLFVAHTNRERSLHEGSTLPVTHLGDRHALLPGLADRLVGAIVSRPVSGLPVDFPLLQVTDPIKAIVELGLAARERFAGPVIAVTGTAGKSSTIGLIETLFTPGRYLKSVDNYNSRVGVPVQLASLAPDHEAAILEVAQSALWMQRGPITRRIKPTIAVVTEIGLSQTNHMVNSTEDVAKWKSRIFDGLTDKGVAIAGEHLLHFDFVLQQAQQHAEGVITFGESERATLRIVQREVAANGTHLTLKVDGALLEVTLPFANAGMVHNALASLCVAYALEMDLTLATERMRQGYQAEEGRLEWYAVALNQQRVAVLDDSWNAEVISMLNAFSALKNQACEGRKIAVLGRIVHLGDQAAELHASLAKPLLETGVDLVMTHGDEMRFLREQLPEGVLGDHFSSADELFESLTKTVQSGDLLLLKGSRRDSDFGDISEKLKALKVD